MALESECSATGLGCCQLVDTAVHLQALAPPTSGEVKESAFPTPLPNLVILKQGAGRSHSILKRHLFYFMCVSGDFAPTDVSAPWTCSVGGNQKMASDPVELELEKVISGHRGARTRTQVL